MTSWEHPGTTAGPAEVPTATSAPPVAEPTEPDTTPSATDPAAVPEAAGTPVWRDWSPSADGPVDAVRYGPDIPTEADLRLLGNVEGKRIVELGCGTGSNAIALALKGARVIGVESSNDDLSVARRRAEEAEIRVELHHGDPAELAFLRADTVDLVLSTWSLARVPDVSRVFRQVHRVLRPEAPLVLSLPHPAYATVTGGTGTPTVSRSYFDRSPLAEGDRGTVHHHTLAELFMALVRTNFRVDVLAEPEPPAGGPRSGDWSEIARLLPRTLVLRARKEGS